MELRQLEYFVAVARHGQFTRAADALWVTQSALSQQIRRLEAELGVALLRRTPRGAEPTPAGEDLLVHAEAALAELAGRASRSTAMPVSPAGACAWRRRRSTRPAFRRRSPSSTASIRACRWRCAMRRPPRCVALVAAGSADVGVAGLYGERAGRPDRRGARRRADVRDAARGRPARRAGPSRWPRSPSARSSWPSRAAGCARRSSPPASAPASARSRCSRSPTR